MTSMYQDKNKVRVNRKSRLFRLRDWVCNQERRYLNIVKAKARTKPANEDEALKRVLLNQMTNWQRNKFLFAIKGNVKTASLGMLQDYAVMPHWKKTRQAA